MAVGVEVLKRSALTSPLRRSPSSTSSTSASMLATVRTPSSSVPPSKSNARIRLSSSTSSSRAARLPRLPHDYRPTSHFMAPKGWMNDPCGPTFDPETGLHHLLYQWNPKGATWGNMSWGHATAPSLAGPWTHANSVDGQGAVLAPEAPYDCEGIFTGCVLRQGPHGEEGILTACYTAVSALPIHFSREYERGCEKLAMATSTDGGRTWIRTSENPLLPGPPEGIEVKSWRDPYVAAWPQMDELLGQPQGVNFYGVIAGSVPKVGPRLFLYRIPRNDLASWSFVSTLGDVGFNDSLPGMPWCAEVGKNWEVGNFFSLASPSTGALTQYVLLNVEGCKKPEPARHPLWIAADFERRSGGPTIPRMMPRSSGTLDDGCAYAASSFIDAPTGRRMMWVWITEDDLPERYYDGQGWSGVMALPREMFQLELPRVISGLISPLTEMGSLQAVPDAQGTFTVSTLGIRPAAELERLRQGASRRCENKSVTFTHIKANEVNVQQLNVSSRSWELCAEVQVTSSTKRVGLILAHTDDYTQHASIAFDPRAERLITDRTRSTRIDEEIKVAPIESALTLLRSANEQGEEVQETLRLRVFCDNSVVEIFANDRLALATRIYPDEAGAVGLSLFADALDDAPQGSDIARFTKLDVWEGLASAF